MPAITVIKFRKGTAAAWASANSVLAAGEPGLETDTNKFKFGDGTTAWNSLDYAGGGTASVVVSDTAPVDPTADMVWFNSAEASAYIYYDSTWVPLSPGIAGPAGPTGIIVSDTAPTNTAQLWADPNATGSYIVPANGTKGQVLSKITDASYDTGWVTPQGSGNAIINGGFDIWQRGTSFSNPTAWSYVADRWRLGYDGSGATRTLSRQAHTPGAAPVSNNERQYFFRYAQTVAGSGATYNRLYTLLEDVRTFAGQVVTFSFYAKAAATTVMPMLSFVQMFGTGGSTTVEDIPIVSNISLGASWQRYSYTFTVPSISGKTIGQDSYFGMYFTFPVNATFTVDIDGVQLEAGSIATPFRRNSPNIQAELAACQRYYVRFTQLAGSYAAYSIAAGAQSATVANASTILPVQMRIPPTSVDYGGTICLSPYPGGSAFNATAIVIAPSGTSNKVGQTQVTIGTSSLSTSSRYDLVPQTGTGNDYLGFSAEL